MTDFSISAGIKRGFDGLAQRWKQWLKNGVKKRRRRAYKGELETNRSTERAEPKRK